MTFEQAWSEVNKTAYGICNKFHVDGYTMDDLMQEAMLEVLNTLKSYDDSKGASFKTYYYYKLHSRFHVILAHIKSKKNYFNVKQYSLDNNINNDGEYDDIFEYIASDYLNPEQQAVKNERMKALNDRISKLNEEFRKIIYYRSQGISGSEIGKKLGLQTQQVFVRMKAIKNLFENNADDQKIKEVNERYNQLAKERKEKRKHA